MQNKLFAAACATAFAAATQMAALADSSSIPPGRSITTQGDAVVKVPPDMFSFTVGIQTQEKQLFTAYDLNEKRAANVLAVAQKFKLRPEDIQTSEMSVYPRRADRSSHALSSVAEPYRVDRQITLVIRDRKQLAPLMRDVLEEGATSLVSLTFDTSELRKHRDTARTLALKAAREKAQLMAESIGSKVGRPIQIEETSSSSYPRFANNVHYAQQQVMMAPGDDGDIDSNAPISGIATGRVPVRASVKATFELE